MCIKTAVKWSAWRPNSYFNINTSDFDFDILLYTEDRNVHNLFHI